jgi:hypothetical protein
MELLIFLLPLLTGLAISLLISTRLGHAWVFIWMAPGIGIGISSLMFFIWSLIFYPRYQPWAYLALELLILIGAALFVWKQRHSLDLRLPRFKLGVLDWLLIAALLAALFFFIYRFLVQTAENPLGGWDAWALWNSRARYFLLGDPDTWRNVFTVHVNQSDYPFMLTGFIARCWVLLGKDRTFVPVVTAALFTVSTVGLLGAEITRLRGLRSGLVASFLLLSLPVFQWTGASQYADMPVAFYLLAALVCAHLYFYDGQDPLALYLVGVFASFALWTKNEGLSILLAIVVSIFLGLLLVRQQPKAILKKMPVFLIGLFPVLLLFVGFKFFLVPPTDLFENRQAASMASQLTDIGRYKLLAISMFQLLCSWGGWKIPFIPLVAGCAVLVGFKKTVKQEKVAHWVLFSILIVTYLQYMAIYLITPHDLAWHLSTSVGRLYNQLLPGSLLLLFLVMQSL